jgi:hypothetical protein
LTGERQPADVRLAAGNLPLVETLNGAMPEAHNARAHRVSRAVGVAAVGGSDAHSLAHVGRAFTTVAGARSREEFLDGLRRGWTVPAGRSGSYARLTSEVVRVFAAGYRETLSGLLGGSLPAPRLAASALLLPLLPLIPLVTLAIYAHELRFGARQFRALQQAFGWPASTAAPSSLGAARLREVA